MIVDSILGLFKGIFSTLTVIIEIVRCNINILVWMEENVYVVILIACGVIAFAVVWPKLVARTKDWYQYSVNYPDLRDQYLCGICSLGWCIMDVLCPFYCTKFHPQFGLRIVVLEAKRMHVGMNNMFCNMYVEAWAKRNPIASTSLMPYDLTQRKVQWNEPVDLVIYPSTTMVEFTVKDQHREPIARVNIPVDGIYEAPGLWPQFKLCGNTCPRLAADMGVAEYRWPFVRGCPRRNPIKEERRLFSRCIERERPTYHDDEDSETPEEKQASIDGLAEKYRMAGMSDPLARQQAQEEVEDPRLALPKPMVISLTGVDNEECGHLFVYLILHDLDDEEDGMWTMDGTEEDAAPEQALMGNR